MLRLMLVVVVSCCAGAGALLPSVWDGGVSAVDQLAAASDGFADGFQQGLHKNAVPGLICGNQAKLSSELTDLVARLL